MEFVVKTTAYHNAAVTVNTTVPLAAITPGGTQDMWENEGARKAGLSANQITNVIGLQGLACFRKAGKLKKTVCDLKASTISFYSSSRD